MESKEFDKTERVSLIFPKNVHDVTHEGLAQKQLHLYAPEITQIGPELRLERYGRNSSWGGLLVRALEKDEQEEKERCLQYIYIWTEQKGAISWLWMLLVPLFMGIWGLVISGFFGFLDWEIAGLVVRFQDAIADDLWGTFLQPSELLLPFWLAGFTGLPFLITAVLLHRWDFAKGSGVSFRSVTLLIPYSLLMWFVPFNWLIPVIIILTAIGVCVLYRILEWREIVKTAHLMDYLPVFIWLRYTGNWELKEASWDRFHYLAERMTRKELIESGNWTAQKDSKGCEIGGRVKLQMANPWHSVRPGGLPTQWYWPWAIKVSLVVLVYAIFQLIMILIAGNYAVFPFDGLNFVFYSFLVTLTSIVLVTMPSPLISTEKELNLPDSQVRPSNEVENHLNDTRLKVLWNLVQVRRDKDDNIKEYDTRPRLKVITKLQDPFNSLELPYYEDDFRDDIEYLYMYITNLNEINVELQTILAEAALINEGYELEKEAIELYKEHVANQALQMAFLPRERIDVSAIKKIFDSSSELVLEAAKAARVEDETKVSRKHVQEALDAAEK